MDMSAIAGAFTSLRASIEIARAIKDIDDANLIRTKVSELTDQIIDAQQSTLKAQMEQAELMERVRTLEAEIAKLKAWDKEKGRYGLKEIQPGLFVYGLKAGEERDEPPHSLCPTCFNRGQKSILQQEMRMPGRMTVQVCHECGTDLIEAGFREEPSRPRGRR